MPEKHLNINFRDRKPKPTEPWDKRKQDDEGPKRPDVDKPDTRDLLRRMRRVDPNQSRRYRQRTGE
ncbi:TPA: ubiquitin-like protein UBact [Candidatus Poribacteria bacterium]|nr:ubiquitin-like protein UBact [Candidatus Poribacteria bacterium]